MAERWMKDNRGWLARCIVVGDKSVTPGDYIVALPRKWWHLRPRVRLAEKGEEADGIAQ